jgi:hypothetical protein
VITPLSLASTHRPAPHAASQAEPVAELQQQRVRPGRPSQGVEVARRAGKACVVVRLAFVSHTTNSVEPFRYSQRSTAVAFSETRLTSGFAKLMSGRPVRSAAYTPASAS